MPDLNRDHNPHPLTGEGGNAEIVSEFGLAERGWTRRGPPRPTNSISRNPSPIRARQDGPRDGNSLVFRREVLGVR
jgi:hypothetical protein